MDTLAFGCILPTTGWIRDFHPLERAPTGRTKIPRNPLFKAFPGIFIFYGSELSSLSGFLDGDCDSDCSADHRVVAHSDQTHHFDVSRN